MKCIQMHRNPWSLKKPFWETLTKLWWKIDAMRKDSFSLEFDQNLNIIFMILIKCSEKYSILREWVSQSIKIFSILLTIPWRFGLGFSWAQIVEIVRDYRLQRFTSHFSLHNPQSTIHSIIYLPTHDTNNNTSWFHPLNIELWHHLLWL